MPAKPKQPEKQASRRSARNIIPDDDEPSAAATSGEEAEIEVDPDAPVEPVNMPPPDQSSPIQAGVNADDSDTVMQEPTEEAANPSSNPSQPHPQNPHSSRSTTTQRAPVERLTSILPSSSRPAALKFKPKQAVRRSKEEREAFERAENERIAARQAAERGAPRVGGQGVRGIRGYGHRGSGSGRGTGYRGRADASYFGRSGREIDRFASGPLGGLVVQEKKQGRKKGADADADASEDEDEGEGDDENVDKEDRATKAKRKGKGKGQEQVKTEDAKSGDGNPGGKAGGTKSRKGEGRKRGSAAGTTSGKGKGRTNVKEEDELPTYISSEGEFDSDSAAKVNIESINLISSDDDVDEDEDLPEMSDIARGKQRETSRGADGRKMKSWMNRPVHVQRQEHVERAMGVNTDASSLLSAELRRKAKERKEGEGGLFLDEISEDIDQRPKKGKRKSRDVEFVRDERKWKGVYIDDDDDDEDGYVKVKSEPEVETSAIDAPLVVEKDDEIPGADAMEIDEVDVDAAVDETNAALHPRAGMEAAKALDKDTTITAGEASLDEEEMTDDEDLIDEFTWIAQLDDDNLTISDDENDDNEDLEVLDDSEEEIESDPLSRHQQEWQTLFEEFKTKSNEPATTSKSKPPPKVTFSSNNEEIEAARVGKTYLIQLPPIIPSLHNSTSKSVPIKKEKKAALAETVSTPPNRSSALSSNDAIKEGSPPPPTDTGPQKIPNAIHQPALSSNFTGGIAGELTFYRSGRTVATWGGMTFDVSPEKEVVGLAQESIMMDYQKVVAKVEDQEKWEDVVTVGGHTDSRGRRLGYSGGKVGGGFCMLGA